MEQFQGQQYLSLETYRKTGAAVATPVWFAEDNDLFYVYSLADAGKVKRIRNNPRVRIAPCSARGFALAAITYQVNKRMVLDAGVRFGLSHDAPASGFIGGLTFGISNFYR